jgi:site-specific recombinase XerD
MDKAEALAYVSRLFDAAQAGAVLWGDKLLMKRFLAQCSRTGSVETQAGYRRELRHFTRWRDQHHPHLHLRELDPALVDDWVSSLREQVVAGLMKPRTYNRRIAALSSLYRWASEPTRSAVTGIPRNPMPRRATYVVPKLAKPMSEDDLSMVLAAIARAAATSTTARRDFVMVKGSYLLGCRVSELCRLQWKDIEPLDNAGQVHLLGKGSKPRTVCISATTLELFESLGRGKPEEWLFPSDRRNGPLTRQAVAARMAKWGREAGVRLYPHRCRHTHATHAIRRGVDVFTLQATLGHSSSGTPGNYVAAEPGDSSSLRLG